MLAGFVHRPVRGSALRPDEHLFRVRSAGERCRQAPLRLQPRQTPRLRAGGDREELLMKLGAARAKARAACGFSMSKWRRRAPQKSYATYAGAKGATFGAPICVDA